MNEKIEALKQTNMFLSRKLKTLNTSLYGTTNYITETMYQSSNDETSLNIIFIKKNQKSKPFIEKEFQRIVCVFGEIKIKLIEFDEEILLTSANTVLIPPNTNYILESIKDTQLIVLFKPTKEAIEKIMQEETIYNKI